jgi:hypothetical protein
VARGRGREGGGDLGRARSPASGGAPSRTSFQVTSSIRDCPSFVYTHTHTRARAHTLKARCDDAKALPSRYQISPPPPEIFPSATSERYDNKAKTAAELSDRYRKERAFYQRSCTSCTRGHGRYRHLRERLREAPVVATTFPGVVEYAKARQAPRLSCSFPPFPPLRINFAASATPKGHRRHFSSPRTRLLPPAS